MREKEKIIAVLNVEIESKIAHTLL